MASRYIAVVLVAIITIAESYQILGLFPHPGVSHFRFFQPILRGLAEAGHDVTVISYFPDKSPPAHYRDLPLEGTTTLTDSVDLKIFDNRRFYGHFKEFFLLNEWGKNACEALLKSSALATILKHSKRYDVILAEQFNTDCMMGVAYILKAPVIGMSSCTMMPWHYDRFGSPVNPSYMPALFMGQSEDMSFVNRVGNWISYHGLKFLYQQYSDKTATDLIRKKFGNDIPDVGTLARETSLLFVNQHYSLSGAKPLSPSIIELGGIHIQKAKPLDVDIQRILDNAEHGVIYISWGSMIRSESLPIEKRDGILKAVGRLKQVVLWKWENDTLPKQPKNVYIRKWLQQREILCHPNVKVFMSHGGLMGTSEAVYCGVPTVLTPMYGDQFLNSASMIHRGAGTLLRYEDIAESTVFKAIKKTLEQKTQDNAKAIQYSFRNRPKKALENAIWWVEHVARTEGAPLLKSSAVYLSWYSFYCLDIYFFFICIILGSVGIWVWIARRFFVKTPPKDKVKKR